MNSTEEHLSYRNIQDGVVIERDDFHLAASLTDSRKSAFFANPNLIDCSQTLMNLIRMDGVIVGRSMLFETKVVIDKNIHPCQSGSTLDVPEQFRKFEIGADLFSYFSLGTNFDYVIASGISEIALPLYKVVKFHILEFPRMMYLRNTKSILESKGIKGMCNKVLTPLFNLPFCVLSLINRLESHRLMKTFSIRKVREVPDWVDELTIRDSHKYKEAHDRKWLQWNLDYNFKGVKNDIQSFFVVEKDGSPIGFFMTKERFRKDAGGVLKNIVLAAIVEWGSFDETILDESMIIKLAFPTFTKNVDIIEFATADENTCKRMKKCGYIKHGKAHIAFLDKTKQCKDASNIDLWRIRYGYADVILT